MASNLITLLRAVTDEQNTLRDEINDTIDIIDIDLSCCDDLDRVGEIVGEPPRSKDAAGEYDISDTVYRENIKTKIELNGSNGEREALIKATKRYTSAASIEIIEYSAEVVIRATAIASQDQLQLINDSVAAGVGLYFVAIPLNPFQYDTGLGYDIGKYADILTIKGVK